MGLVSIKNHRLSSDHFKRNQIQRDPATLKQYDYDGSKIPLKSDAVPDVPISIPSENVAIAVSLPTKYRGGTTN